MLKIWSIARTDLRITFSERSIWVNLIIVPIALILVVGIANSGLANVAIDETQNRQNIDIIDHDESSLSAQFIETLVNIAPNLRPCPAENTTDDVCGLENEPLTEALSTDRLDANRSRALIIIPAGFESDILNGENITITYRSGESATQNSVIQQAVNTAAQQLGAAELARNFAQEFADSVSIDDLPQRVYDRALEFWTQDLFSLEYIEREEDEETNRRIAVGFQQSVPGMGSMYVLFTVLAGAVILIQERSQWTLQRLTTMPVTRGQFIAGKMLSRFIMGMIQFGVAFATGYVLTFFTDLDLGNSLIGLVLVMAAFTAVASALTLLIATLTTSEDQAGSVVTLLALTLAPLGGAWWSLQLEFIPDFMKQLSYVSPIRWAMDGFNNVIVFGGTWVDVLPQVGVLLAMAAVLFALSTWRLRSFLD